MSLQAAAAVLLYRTPYVYNSSGINTWSAYSYDPNRTIAWLPYPRYFVLVSFTSYEVCFMILGVDSVMDDIYLFTTAGRYEYVIFVRTIPVLEGR